MKSDLEKFRSRWYRWLGQKTRRDKPHWTTLLDTNWIGWARSVLKRIDYPSVDPKSRADVYYFYRDAIAEATMSDLHRLDNLFCQEALIRGKG